MSVYKKIILIAGIILSFAIGINTIVSTSFFNKEYSKMLESRAIGIGQTLKAQLDRVFSLGILLDELVGFEEQCKETVNKYKDIRSAMVVDIEGRILFHNDLAQQGKILTNVNILKYLNDRKDAPTVIREYKENYYDAVIPIYNLNNQRVGTLIIGFSLEPVVRRIRALVICSFFITLISFISAISLLFWAVNLWINRPLAKLVSAIQEIGKEGADFKGRIEVNSKDELGKLADSFNKMASNLQKTTVSIEVLKEEQKRFSDVADNSGDWIWEVDSGGRYIYSSPVVEKILGYKPEEVLGKYFYDFFIPQEREQMKKAALEAFSRKETFHNFLNRNIHKDGRMVIFETSGVPLVADNGDLLGYRGIDRDITERKRAEEQQMLLLKDLEDMNRIMVGRELKMIELKKEINGLSRELGIK